MTEREPSGVRGGTELENDWEWVGVKWEPSVYQYGTKSDTWNRADIDKEQSGDRAECEGDRVKVICVALYSSGRAPPIDARAGGPEQ